LRVHRSTPLATLYQMPPRFTSFGQLKAISKGLLKTAPNRYLKIALTTRGAIPHRALGLLQQLYRTVYLNFVTRIDRTLMEKLAQELVNTNSVSMVSKIYDQYLDVIALEPSLFTLNIRDSFTLYNEPSLTEGQIRQAIL
jgi:hypothetical protein